MSESEESQAPGQVLHLPLSAIEEDPNQPRKHFAGDALEELALNIEKAAGASAEPWIAGLLHPIVVYESPAWFEGSDEPRYRLLAGGRRYRTYRLRRWPVIPARVVPPPEGAFQTLLIQLNENLGRKDTSLWEDAQAVEQAWKLWQFENPGGTARDLAQALGRSPTWVSQRLAMSRAVGAPQQALAEHRIANPDVYRAFTRLAGAGQIEILERSRKTGDPITLQAIRLHQPRSRPLPELPPTATDAMTSAGNEAAAASLIHAEVPELLTLFLAPHQARFVLFSLNHPIPEEDSELMAALNTALAKIPA